MPGGMDDGHRAAGERLRAAPCASISPMLADCANALIRRAFRPPPFCLLSSPPRIWGSAQFPALGPKRLHKDPSLSIQSKQPPQRRVAAWLSSPTTRSPTGCCRFWRAGSRPIPHSAVPHSLRRQSDGHAQAAKAYGVTIVEDVDKRIDKLAAELYPFFPGHRRRLRKLQSLALPLDEGDLHRRRHCPVPRLRADVRPAEEGETEFIIASPSFEYVYNKKKDEVPTSGRSAVQRRLFRNLNKFLNLDMFVDTMTRDAKVFDRGAQARHAVRPVVNFTCHRNHREDPADVRSHPQRLARDLLQGEGRDLQRRRAARPGRPGDLAFCHWAGLQSQPGKLTFDDAWRSFSQAAWAKVGR